MKFFHFFNLILDSFLAVMLLYACVKNSIVCSESCFDSNKLLNNLLVT